MAAALFDAASRQVALPGPADRSCCCVAKAVVRVVMPPTPARPHETELLLCGHHYRVSRQALAAAHASVVGAASRAANQPVAAIWHRCPLCSADTGLLVLIPPLRGPSASLSASPHRRLRARRIAEQRGRVAGYSRSGITTTAVRTIQTGRPDVVGVCLSPLAGQQL